jgi:hypothetical protein
MAIPGGGPFLGGCGAWAWTEVAAALKTIANKHETRMQRFIVGATPVFLAMQGVRRPQNRSYQNLPIAPPIIFSKSNNATEFLLDTRGKGIPIGWAIGRQAKADRESESKPMAGVKADGSVGGPGCRLR